MANVVINFIVIIVINTFQIVMDFLFHCSALTARCVAPLVWSTVIFIVNIVTETFRIPMDYLFPCSSLTAECVELIELSTAIFELRHIELVNEIERRLVKKEKLKKIISKYVYPLTLPQKDEVDSVKLLIPAMRLEDKKYDAYVLKMEYSFDKLSSQINGVIFPDKHDKAMTNAIRGYAPSFEQFVSAQKTSKSVLLEIVEMLDRISRQQARFEAPA